MRDVVRIEEIGPRERHLGPAAAPGWRSGIGAVVHEARIVGAAWTARAVGLEVVAPALRQVGVEVLDRVQLVVKVAVDQGPARPCARRCFADCGDDHGCLLTSYSRYQARALSLLIFCATPADRCRRSTASGSAACWWG